MIWVRTAGRVAQEALGSAEDGTVLGMTSRGLFLHLPPARVIFLSSEPFAGPLTLNLAGSQDGLSSLSAGQPARLSPAQIIFSGGDLTISMDQAELWSAPPRPVGVLTPAACRDFSTQVLHRAAALKPTAGLAHELSGRVPGEASQAHPAWADLRQALTARDAAALAGALMPWLGLGPGLTPSGDDLALGLLLGLARWGDVLAPGLEVSTLWSYLAPTVAARTTLLSANLLACAALGQADQRLVHALDGLVTGLPGAAGIAAALAGWGSSSGLDALAGMALLLISEKVV